jgi:6-phosphogluconolactonase
METRIAATPENVAKEFADFLADRVTGRHAFHIALSGGSTPMILFDLLANEYADRLPWGQLHFYWGDERCVPPSHDDSNFKMTEARLLSKVPIPKENIHRILGESDPEKEAARYAAEILKNVPINNLYPRFDMIILGMGPDGHTASIFPHQMELLDKVRICEVATHPESGQKRITLTGPVINNAECIAFLVTGGNKKAKVKEILDKTGNWKLYPAAHIQPTDGQLIWFLDAAAKG